MTMKDYRTIVVGTDGSSLAEPTVGRASWLAKHDDANLVMLQGWSIASKHASLISEDDGVYILSLGSQAGNSHIHWHVAPLPPGVPFEQQQFAALDAERAGVLAMDEAELAQLARSIAQAIRL